MFHPNPQSLGRMLTLSPGKPQRSLSRNYALTMGCAAGRELEAARCEAEKERAVSRERELAACNNAARDREALLKDAAKDRELALTREMMMMMMMMMAKELPAKEAEKALSPMRAPPPQALPPAMRRAMPSARPLLRRPAPLPPQSSRPPPQQAAAMTSGAAPTLPHTTDPHQPSELSETSRKQSAARPTAAVQSQPHRAIRRTATPTSSTVLPVARYTAQPDTSAATTTGTQATATATASSNVLSSSPAAVPVELRDDFFLSHYQTTGGDQVPACCSLLSTLNASWAAGVGSVGIETRTY